MEDDGSMITYSQFCPVAKAAEVFGDRWTPIIMRELCFGARAFGELLEAAPLISRTVLAQRLKQLQQSGVVQIVPKPNGKGHLYQLTPAGADFRQIVELLSVWGQRWGQGLIGPDDLDPKMLVWGMRRQIDPEEIPAQGFVIRLDFRGIPKGNRSPRYWWLVMRPDDIEVCLKAPARDVDVVIAADLMTFTKAWLGYIGLASAVENGRISLHGSGRAIAKARRLLALPDQPTLKTFKFSAFPAARAVAA
jgi:DNA-binding HxlR family transcriptional regulator